MRIKIIAGKFSASLDERKEPKWKLIGVKG